MASTHELLPPKQRSRRSWYVRRDDEGRRGEGEVAELANIRHCIVSAPLVSATVVRRVRGVLFADYVRMMRGKKDVDWSKHVQREDLAFLQNKVNRDEWYPMATFERFGNAILSEIAGNDVEAVRHWGQFSVDQLRA